MIHIPIRANEFGIFPDSILLRSMEVLRWVLVSMRKHRSSKHSSDPGALRSHRSPRSLDRERNPECPMTMCMSECLTTHAPRIADCVTHGTLPGLAACESVCVSGFVCDPQLNTCGSLADQSVGSRGCCTPHKRRASVIMVHPHAGPQ